MLAYFILGQKLYIRITFSPPNKKKKKEIFKDNNLSCIRHCKPFQPFENNIQLEIASGNFMSLLT